MRAGSWVACSFQWWVTFGEPGTGPAISCAVAQIDSNRGAGALQMASPAKAGVVVLAAGSGTARLVRRVGAEIPQQLVSQTVILTDPVRAVTRASWPALPT